MDATLTTFWYELDRSACTPKFRRSRESYIQKLVQLLKNAFQNPKLHVLAFVESSTVKQEVLSFLSIDFSDNIVVKPLHTWSAFETFNSAIHSMLTSWKGTITTPETFDSKYVCLNLSKVNAVLHHASLFNAPKHLWIDGGYRWDTSLLSTVVPDWKESKVYFSELKPFHLMGGVFGGSTQVLEAFNFQILEQIPIEISKGKPFTDQTVYSAIAKKHPEQFFRIKLYSRGLVGNFFFHSAFLDRMLTAMVKTTVWEQERPWLARSEVIILILVFFLVIVSLQRQL